MKYNTQTNRRLIVFLIIFLITWFIYSISAATTVLSLIIIYFSFNKILNIEIFNSKFIRLCITPLFYIFGLQITILSLWLVSRNFPLNVSPIVFLVVILITYFCFALVEKQHGSTSLQKQSIKPITRPDIIALSVGVLIVSALLVSPFINSGTLSKSNILGTVNANVDDAAHIGMINDHIQFNRGIMHGSDATNSARAYPDELTIYPAGWHSANAAIIKAFNPSIKTGLETVFAYVITKLFWFLLLIIFFVRSIFTLYDVFSPHKKRALAATAWLTFTSLFFSYYFLIDTFREGFYSFFPQLMSLSVLGLVLIQLGKSNTGKIKGIPYHIYVMPIIFLCIAGSLSWLLMVPALLLTIALVISLRIKEYGWKICISELWRSFITFLPLYIILLSAIIVQVYVSTRPGPESSSFLDTLSLPGPIAQFKDIFYYFVSIGLALFFRFFNARALIKLRALLALTVPILLFAASVYALQIFHVDHNSYYYYKVLNTFLVISLPLALVGYGLALAKVQILRKSRFITMALAIILMAGVVQFIGLVHSTAPSDISLISYVKGVRHSNATTNEAVWIKMKNNLSQGSYFNNNYVFFYEPGARMDQGYTNTMILKSNKPADICFFESLGSFVSPGANIYDILKTIDAFCSKSHTVTIVTDTAHKDVLKNTVTDSGMNNLVTVQSYDDIISK